MIHPFDLMAIFLLIGFGYVGYNRGFLEEVGRLAGLIIASSAGFQFHNSIAILLHSYVPIDKRLITFGSFTIVFVVVLLGTRIVKRFIQIFLLAKGVRSINRMMGIAVGTLKTSVVTIIFCWSIDVLPNSYYFGEMKMTSYVYHNSSGIRSWIISAFHLEGSVERGETWVKKKIEAY